MLEPVGGEPHQFEVLRPGQACRELPQPVARQHQLLQERPLAQRVGKVLDPVIRERQPAQRGRKRLARDLAQARPAEAELTERDAIAE